MDPLSPHRQHNKVVIVGSPLAKFSGSEHVPGHKTSYMYGVESFLSVIGQASDTMNTFHIEITYSHTPDPDFRCFYQCEIILSHIPMHTRSGGPYVCSLLEKSVAHVYPCEISITNTR